MALLLLLSSVCAWCWFVLLELFSIVGVVVVWVLVVVVDVVVGAPLVVAIVAVYGGDGVVCPFGSVCGVASLGVICWR